MKRLSAILLLAVLTTGALIALPYAPAPESTAFKGYELYSWQDSGRTWVFCILPGTNALKNEDQVFGSAELLRGTAELKKRMAELPQGAAVFWLSDNALRKSSQRRTIRLSYPPSDVVQELKRYAQEHQTQLNVSDGIRKE